MVRGNPPFMPLAMADDIFLRKPIQPAEVDAQLHRLPVHLMEIGSICQTVLADLKRDIRIIPAPLRPGAAMPPPPVPGQRLVCGNRPVRQLPDKPMDADLPPGRHRLVPVVIVFIHPQKPVIRADIPLKPRVIRPGGMHHDPLRHDPPTRLIAGIFRKDQLM